MFCHGIEGEGEKVEGDSDLDSDYYEDGYDHVDNWDLEELVVNLEDEEESNNNNKEEDDNRCTASECVYMNAINTYFRRQ